ncbi:MAG TPA: hypothetical protein DHW82_02745 [Spirochaetia bacterium]|nr:MAG: hypothetical protein A2Y41_10615 [Spirochaetes bacterium GWB1_36_13]HCL55910.1 hypothetical protein [Spirochaetia bacterium]
MNELIQKISKDPYAEFLGISFDEIKEGFAVCSLTIHKNSFNFLGAVHGGLIFSLADAAFSAASNFDYSPSFALDISGSFLKSPKLGDRLKAEAKLIHTTRRTGLYNIQVFHNQELIAVFNGTVFRKI